MRGDIVDGGNQLRMVEPDVPGFTRGDRDIGLLLHLADDVDQLGRGLFRAQDRLVADHHADDIGILARGIDRIGDLVRVAGLVLVDPGADRDLQALLGRDLRHQLQPAGGGIGAHGARIGRDRLDVGADLRLGGGLALVRIGAAPIRREREAGKAVGNSRRRDLLAHRKPDESMHGRDYRDHGGGNTNSGAHGPTHRRRRRDDGTYSPILTLVQHDLLRRCENFAAAHADFRRPNAFNRIFVPLCGGRMSDTRLRHEIITLNHCAGAAAGALAVAGGGASGLTQHAWTRPVSFSCDFASMLPCRTRQRKAIFRCSIGQPKRS